MGKREGRRRAIVYGLGITLLVLFLALAALNAFNVSFLNDASPIQTLVFVALSVVAFLLFVGVLVLLVRNVLKLYADQRSRVLGTRLRTRMLWGAVLVSIAPLVFMFAFSYLLMNRSVDRWFSQPVLQMRHDADQLALELFRYTDANARSEADSLSLQLSYAPDPAPILQAHELTLQGGFAVIYRDGKTVNSLRVPKDSKGEAVVKSLQPPEPSSDSDESPSTSPTIVEIPLTGPAEDVILLAAQRTDDPFFIINGADYTLAKAALTHGGFVLVGLPIPPGISATTNHMATAAEAYWTLFRERRQVRNLYTIYLLLTTVLALFVCCWLALYLSKQVTRPVESLADAMEAVAAGDYAHRVGQSATEELGELVESFNAMASDLESAHARAELSTQQLFELNTTLQQRRTELETIIETIPNGVVTLSADRRIILANRAFSEMLDPGGQKRFVGLALEEALPAEIVDTLDRILRRAHRMGSASVDMEMTTNSGIMNLSATVALLEDGWPADREHLGYVLVLEDATELLRAQKQSAWKEVARRVAHEIKNPLTPISLNSELIARHIARLNALLTERNIESPSPAVIQRSAEVITSSVETMRSLVDQFSALAEFPSARPRPADINTIVENSLALFAGRLGNIRVQLSLAPALPLVFADPEALKRALTNLVDNAAEAMQSSLLRELHISTRLLNSGMIELTVADTGPGLTDEMRERLFLPYFSTKQRGTGLGLSIAAKIVQEHQGTIRSEKIVPAGAKVIIELKAASNSDGDAADLTSESGSEPAPTEGVSA